MKKICLVLISAFLVFSCTESKKTFELTHGVHISGVTILAGENGDFSPFNGHVVTEGEKILYVGEAEPKVRGEYRKIEGKGKYLIPGLIDSHVHITEVQGMAYQQLEKNPELVAGFKAQMPRSYLYFGFTTLVNLGGISQDLIDFIHDQPLKPDLYHTGWSGASVANGYPMNFAPESIRFEITPNFIYLESEAENIPDQYDPADHTPEAVVKRIGESGAIAVKAYYETGFHGMADLPVPTKEILVRLQEEAHKNGLVLTVHGNSLEAHAILSEVGVDIIAHGLWNWGAYKSAPKDSLPEEIKSVLDKQIEKQIGYTPTLTVLEGERVLADRAFLDDPRLRKVIPGAMITWYRSEEGQWFAKELFEGYSPEEVNEIYGRIQAHGDLALKYLSDNGGLILFGTDTPSAPTYGNPPGLNGYAEIRMMHEAGVPLDKILASATVNNAAAFHLDSLVGSIAVGKRANMLLLTKNPMEEVEAYDHIDKIILGGEVVEREELSVRE